MNKKLTGMSSLPLVSIITPSFNQSEYLEETILSVLNQDYENIEYIIIDGGSTDGSIDIIKKYEDKLAYWISEPDKGQTDAIIKGFNKSNGSFLTWLCSDDLLVPSMIRLSVHFLQKYPEHGLTFGDRIRIDSKGNVYSFQRYPQFRKMYLRWGFTLPQETVLFRREIYEYSGGLNPSLEIAMDYDLWCKMSKKTNFFHIPAYLGKFRMHESSKSTIFSDKQKKSTFLELHMDKLTFDYEYVMYHHFRKKPSAFYKQMGKYMRQFSAVYERRKKKYKSDAAEATRIRLQ